MDEAAAEIRQALTLTPSPSTGMAASLQEAIKIDPQYWPARKNAGIALGNLGRNVEAIEQLQIYLAANPDDNDIAPAIAALRAGK